MQEIYIGEVWEKIADSVPILASIDQCTAKILQWILKNVDYSVPSKLFKEWADGDTTKPFIWNNVKYNWGKK
jgi:hypothetical protein